MLPNSQPLKVLREGFRGEVSICTQLLFKTVQEKKIDIYIHIKQIWQNFTIVKSRWNLESL